MDIPVLKIKAALKAFNATLKKNKKPIIPITASKQEKIKQFTEKVLEFINDDKVEELPDEVVDFYNTYLVPASEEEGGEAEGEETETETTEAPAKKSAPRKRKTAAGKKPADKKPAPKKKTEKVVSVVERTVQLFLENPETDIAAINDALEAEFPGRKIRSTISSAMCVLKHVKGHLK